MTSLDDLAFMPFVSTAHDEGDIEISIDEETSLFVREVSPTEEDGPLSAMLVMIVAIGAQRMTAF